MWSTAIVLAEATDGYVFDPQDGKWFDAIAAWKKVSDGFLTDEAVDLLLEEIGRLRGDHYPPGPHGVRVEDVGINDEWVTQFLVMGAADIEEGDAFELAINTPFEILRGQLSKAAAESLMAVFCRADVEVSLTTASQPK